MARAGIKCVPISSQKTIAFGVAVCAITTVLLVAWEFQRPWFQGNLAVVDPGNVIRSAQPASQLPRWISEFQLKSIINLRGGSPADSWYATEVRTAREKNLSFYDLPISATRRPGRLDLLRLIDVLQQCPYPLLIHCKSGADRTGLVSALYLMLKCSEPPQRAQRAFSLEFGHIPIGGTQHLHEPLDEYAAWLKANRLTHTPVRFRDWVRNHYQSPDPSLDPPLSATGPRPRR